MDKFEIAFYKIGGALTEMSDIGDEDLLRLVSVCMSRLEQKNILNTKFRVYEFNELIMILQHSLLELLEKCAMEDLLCFNAQSYVLYAGFFGELKLRIMQEAFKEKNSSANYAKSLMEKRFTFLKQDAGC